MACGICPNCGLDLVQDEPDSYAGIDMAPYGNARIDGHEVHLTKCESAVLWSLVKAHGRPLSRAVLAERTGHEGDHNCVDVYLTRLRHKLPSVSINTLRGVGVYIEA